MQPRVKAADLTLREAAAALGLSVGTVRAHVKAGRLPASQAVGRFGPEYRLRPAVVAAFGAERLGLELDADALGKRPPAAGDPVGEDVRDLYERLLAATEEATRYKALNAASEAHYRDDVARLQHERDAAQDRAAAAEAQAAADLAALAAERDAAQADADRLRSRSWWARTFGGRG